jgi:hypothetical protein
MVSVSHAAYAAPGTMKMGSSCDRFERWRRVKEVRSAKRLISRLADLTPLTDASRKRVHFAVLNATNARETPHSF